MKFKLLITAVFIMYISTAILCIMLDHPLIFLPVKYGIKQFLNLGILVAIPSFCLVYIVLPTMRLIAGKLRIFNNSVSFYIIGSWVVLTFTIMFFGYLESRNDDYLFYYRGIGNSLIYIFTTNFTTIIVSWLYAK